MADPVKSPFVGKEKTAAGEEKTEHQKVQFRSELPESMRRLIGKIQENYHFFAGMEDWEIAQFLKLCRRDTHEKEHRIFGKGETGECFYLIVSGEIIIRLDDTELARLGPGEIFGEMAMLDDIKRTATAVAGETSTLFTIDRTVLTNKMPALALKVITGIAKQLSERLQEADKKLRELEPKKG